MRRLSYLSATAACVVPIAAQCAPAWQPGHGFQGIHGRVAATITWDPDGGGPLGPRQVFAGEFSHAGGIAASNIVALDPATATWSAFGGGLDRPINALAVLANGDLVAGGAASSSATSAAISRWSGATWQAMGVTAGTVDALLTLANGDLLAGGSFTAMNGIPAAKVARFNGAGWSAVGNELAVGGASGEVFALTALRSGRILATGFFPFAADPAMRAVAEWNGTRFSPLGSGTGTTFRGASAVQRGNGDVIVAGSEGLDGRLLRWDGANWSTLAAAVGSTRVVQLDNNGDLLVGGAFESLGRIPLRNLARFDGATWRSVGAGVSSRVDCIGPTPGAEFYVGGDLVEAGGEPAEGAARWTGTRFAPLATGNAGQVLAVLALSNNDIVVAGRITAMGGVTVSGVARGDGSNWRPLGSGPGFLVVGLAQRRNGDLIACGYDFPPVNPIVGRVARWNGNAWLPVATSAGAIQAAAQLGNGDIVFGGGFTSIGGVAANYLARWDGTSFAPMPGLLADGPVTALLAQGDGDLLVGSLRRASGSVAPSNVARLRSGTWTYLGTGTSSATGSSAVYAIAELRNGEVAIGGLFDTTGGVNVGCVARWDGVAWRPMGAGFVGTNDAVLAMTLLPSGDLVASGAFATSGATALNHIARWDGQAWSALDGGITLQQRLGESVAALAVSPEGDLLAGGSFAAAGGRISANFARLTPGCRATVSRLGAGCASSGGNNAITASRAWTGGAWSVAAFGLPASGAALVALGANPVNVPLRSLIAQGQPGCTLFVAPDLHFLMPIVAGSMNLRTSVPADPSLAGGLLHVQVLPLEVSGAGALLAVTATDALRITIGWL